MKKKGKLRKEIFKTYDGRLNFFNKESYKSTVKT